MTKKQLIAFNSMLMKWHSQNLVRSTTYYQYIETDKDAYERGYRAALHHVSLKIDELIK